MSSISEVMSKSKFLSKLCLQNCNISDSGLSQIKNSICDLSHLTYLDLSGNDLNDQSLKSISSIFNRTYCFEYLDLSNNQFGTSKSNLIAKYISNLPNLTFLNLSNNQISDSFCCNVTLSSNLTSLYLHSIYLYIRNSIDNQITENGIATFSNRILRCLDLANFSIGGNLLKDEWGSTFLSSLLHLKSLELLDLSCIYYIY